MRRPFIPKRRPIFIGCEGESESGYASFLQDLINAAGISVYLVIENLGIGAGEPQTRMEQAIRKIEHLRRTRTAPSERFVLFDHDQVSHNQDRTEAALRLAQEYNIQIVWQRPCFEAVLLRHLPQCATRRPGTSADAVRVLKREWPEYLKPMTRAELAQRIDHDAVRRVSAVEHELYLLLEAIGLI